MREKQRKTWIRRRVAAGYDDVIFFSGPHWPAATEASLPYDLFSRVFGIELAPQQLYTLKAHGTVRPVKRR